MIDQPEAERIAATLLPPLKPYVLFESADLPVVHVNVLGSTHRDLDAAVHEWLKSRGQWRGRQPVVLICDLAIRQFAPGIENETALATLVHECGHVGAWGIPKPRPLRTAKSLANAAYATPAPLDETDLVPWFGHDANFVRTTIHLAFRAAKLGIDFHMDLLFSHEVLGLAPASEFAATLQDEVREFVNVSPFKICELQPPQAFTKLWDSCVRAWLRTQTTVGPAVHSAIRSLFDAQLA